MAVLSGENPAVSRKAPRTVVEAFDRIAVKLSHEDRTNIAEVPADSLYILHYDLGKFIRNEVGLWSDNIPLLLDCQRLKEGQTPDTPTPIHPDDASTVIVEALWRRLRDQWNRHHRTDKEQYFWNMLPSIEALLLRRL
jgi:hypothetical protein